MLFNARPPGQRPWYHTFSHGVVDAYHHLPTQQTSQCSPIAALNFTLNPRSNYCKRSPKQIQFLVQESESKTLKIVVSDFHSSSFHTSPPRTLHNLKFCHHFRFVPSSSKDKAEKSRIIFCILETVIIVLIN